MSLATKLAFIPNITTNYIPRATATGFVNGMVYDDGTNVTIGGTTGGYKLNVLGTLNATGSATFASVTIGAATALNWGIRGGIIQDGSWNFSWNTNSVLNALYIQSSTGNVGIGTSSPINKLHVTQANGTAYSSTPQLRISGGNINNNRAQILFSDDNLSDGKISYYPATPEADRLFSISARAVESDFVIRGNGNVGIGITNPSGQLSIKNQTYIGSSPISSYAAGSGADGQNFFNGYYTFNNDGLGTYPRYLDIVSVGNPDGTNGGSNIRFFTNPVVANSPAVERMRITSGGVLQVYNTIVCSPPVSLPTLDTSGSFTTLVPNAYVDFPGMSGMIIVNNTGTGALQVFICGGGNTASLGSVVNTTGTMTHSPGVGGYRFTNNTGSTWTFAFQVFKTRGTA